MAAHDATLTEAIVHLDTTWVGIRDSVLNDHHLLWIGSGISRERFPALPELLEQLFESLHAAQDPANPDCPYLKKGVEIVASYSGVTGLDLRQPPAAWATSLKTQLFKELTSNYAKVLGVNVNVAGVPRNIPFDILKLDETYSAAGVMPDAEHRLLALLMAEGAVTQIVTTNWDPLTERAHKALGVSPDPWIIACAAELDGASGAASIFKVHGCAERSMAEPAKYKQHMIATHHQITCWSMEPLFRPFFEKLRTLLRERPSDGQLRVVSPGAETCLFLLRQGVSAIQELEIAGAIVSGSGRKVLIIYPVGSEPKNHPNHGAPTQGVALGWNIAPLWG